ncbi:MAG TPA: hypothetical protein VEA69_04730 [Tepidisphaeraceae bacterium]|nr:hypothetical protein [Tepidisphaeraceae bacterium]
MYPIILGVLLIVTGGLAAAAWIVSKRPDAKAAIDKLVPSQAILGIITALWSVVTLFLSIRDYSRLSDIAALASAFGVSAPSRVWMLIIVIASIVGIVLGLFLGYGLIAKKAMAGSPEAAAKGEALRLKLVTYQTPLGLAGLVLGLLSIISYFMLR